MAEQARAGARPTDRFGRALYSLATILAILGGLVSCAMAVLVTVSVTGRYLFSKPIPSDYDIVGILAGCAIFAFLPYCQLYRGNVLADFFTHKAPARVKSALDAGGNILFLAAIILFTWRLYYGLLDMRQSSEQIAMFSFYRWWTLPFDIFCMVVLICAIFYTLLQDIAAVKATEPSPEPRPGGAASHE
jgi:TRAP-type C4-dicarboxylate transport system permease small subunit